MVSEFMQKVMHNLIESNQIKMYLVPSIGEPDQLGNTVSKQLKQLK